MVHIYYHIYTEDGVESIIDEQIGLIQKHFDFEYKLNIGISIANENVPSKPILDKIYDYKKHNYKIRDIRCKGSEWVTLDLIEEDKNKFDESDYILYIHTKGISRNKQSNYKNIESWRYIMNHFNIERVDSVFRLFEKSDFNTYGILYRDGHYSGNFWWGKSNFIKSIDLVDVDKNNRFTAEVNYLKCGKNWKPFSPYNIQSKNPYALFFKREEYEK